MSANPIPTNATEESRRLLAVARELMSRCPAQLGQEIAVTGSVARGLVEVTIPTCLILGATASTVNMLAAAIAVLSSLLTWTGWRAEIHSLLPIHSRLD